MKCVLFSAALCICFLETTQAPGRGQSSQAAAVPSVASTADAEVSAVEKDFVGLADAMPEDKYSFAPSNGEFKACARSPSR